MRGYVRLTALLVLLWAITCPAQESIIRGRCVATIDGDSLKVLTAEKQLLRIRVAWIDAPELGQAFGQRAKQAMSELVFGKEVELRPHTIDRYGRLVCMVFVEGRDAGLELIKQGLAWKYDRYLLSEAPAEIQQSYTATEAAARATRVGLWQDKEPIAPWLYRQTEREQRAQMQAE